MLTTRQPAHAAKQHNDSCHSDVTEWTLSSRWDGSKKPVTMCSLHSEAGNLHTLVKSAMCATIVLMTPVIDVLIPQIRTSNDTTCMLNTAHENLFRTRDLMHADSISSCASSDHSNTVLY
jgi:hypothetical protein